ncbi:MAG: phosphate ABC transporter ATP-binding protein, partial [Candidatus Omnitrophica bacterium]|nr:phosphate ABC transporter ATP-binding protein [Candidatus Omnitrophota bacterium]
MVEEQKLEEAKKIQVRDLSVFFGSVHALKGATLDVKKNEILGAIGPANSGKTTFLRCLNRM